MKKWTKEMMESDIISISKGIGRMPTNTELISMGRGDLANQITKKGGFHEVAKRLNLTQVKSDSSFGWEGEIMARELLEEHGFSVERQAGVRWPFDLLVDECVRVDVKVAKFAQYGPCSGWFFRIGKTPQADIIMLLQFDTRVAYYLHWMDCPTSNITISKGGGKYANFANAVDVVKRARESVLALRRGLPTVISKSPTPA